MMNLTFACRLTALCSIGVSLAGCGLAFNEPPWTYVNRVGGPRRITEWTLQQVECDRIQDGQLALLGHALSLREDPADTRAAAEGYLRVYQQGLAGWPVTRAPDGFPPSAASKSILGLAPEERRRFVEIYVIRSAYESVANSVDWQRSASEMALLRELYLKMRPDPNDPERFAEWRRNGTRTGLISE